MKKSFITNFLTSEAKKAFTYLQKAFIKALIFKDLDLESHIYTKTNTLEYVIDEILSQMTLDKHFFDHMTHKKPNFEISQ